MNIDKYLGAHQPAFMPWMGYLHRIALSSTFVILDDVQFEKNSFINRNIIKNSNTNEGQWLTVPVSSKGHFSKTIKQIELDHNSNWKKKHLSRIKHEYKNEPFFEERYPQIENIYNINHKYFKDFIDDILNYILDLFLIETTLVYQSDLKIHGKGTQLIVNLCKNLRFKKFIFGIEGINYFNKKLFSDYSLTGYEHKYNCKYSETKFRKKNKNISSLDLIFTYDKAVLSKILLSDNKHKLTKLQ